MVVRAGARQGQSQCRRQWRQTRSCPRFGGCGRAPGRKTLARRLAERGAARGVYLVSVRKVSNLEADVLRDMGGAAARLVGVTSETSGTAC
eukprot:1590859-Pleurochrysis_carterae.AAC.4